MKLRPRRKTPVVERERIGFCEVCGEPGERFTASQPGFLCTEHMLLGLTDPAEFERQLTEANG